MIEQRYSRRELTESQLFYSRQDVGERDVSRVQAVLQSVIRNTVRMTRFTDEIGGLGNEK
jgi:hypothetical protein